MEPPPDTINVDSSVLSTNSASASTKASEVDPHLLVSLLQLESQARAAQTVKELCFLLANETRRLVSFRQACVFSFGAHLGTTCQVEVVSSVAVVDRKSPMVQWIEEVVSSMWEQQASCKRLVISMLSNAPSTCRLIGDDLRFLMSYGVRSYGAINR